MVDDSSTDESSTDESSTDESSTDKSSTNDSSINDSSAGGSVIARIWHGTTPTAKADEYLAFLRSRAIPDYTGVPGNLAVYLLRRTEGDITHFLTLTHWRSLEAIKAFAGDDIARAKYYPEDAGFLLEFEPTVEHYELYAAT